MLLEDWQGGGELTPDKLVNELAFAFLLVKVYVTGNSTASTTD